jgi:(1->4)-alpha-D-glucan 1-alpha-D-glucosylmutase
MASELNVLAREAARVAREHPRTADFTQNVLRRAIREIVACFPVYRTYVDWEGCATAEDRRDLNWAMKQARANDTDIDPTVFDFVGDLLSGDLVAHSRSGFSRHAVLRCAMKLQQYSGPVMAKGLEDTAFYRYNRLIALNEVGGYPDIFGSSVSAFHRANEQRLRFLPHSMLTTSTHDTKRGEDARARLAVLSEMPEVWAKQTRLWSKLLRARRADIQATAPPEQNDEYLFYQMLLGSWPVELMSVEDFQGPSLGQYLGRLREAMRKSIREAKVHSTWASPNVTYENAVMDFIDGALDPESSSAFLSEFLPFALRIAQLGVENSLVQTALKLTAPGVPDTYQGSELWELSMVDPDNRRPVDYASRAAMLKRLDETRPSIRSLMHEWQSGAVKLFLTSRILRLRAAEPELFAEGGYEPLLATGSKAECICGFTRRKGSRAVVVITALFPARRQREPGWPSTSIALPQELSQVTFRSLFSEARLPASDLEEALDFAFDESPVAVLIVD